MKKLFLISSLLFLSFTKDYHHKTSLETSNVSVQEIDRDSYGKEFNESKDVRISQKDLQKHQKEIIEYVQRFDIFSELEAFNDFKYVSDNEQNYVYGSAKSSTGENVVLRFTVELDGDYIILTHSGSTGESCTGKNCSECAFAQKGGCECKRIGGISTEGAYCNHSIRKN